MNIIDMYNKLVKDEIYPTKKEWFYKYGYHGSDYKDLIEFKKKSLKQIDLPTIENSLYYNQEIVSKKLREFNNLYLTSDLDSFLEYFEEIMIYSEIEGSLSIEGIKTSKKKLIML